MGEQYIHLLDYKNHQQYLNSFMSIKDLRYLRSKQIARGIISLGYRTPSAPYDNKEFDRRVDLAMQTMRPKISGDLVYSKYMSPHHKDPVLLEYKKREIPIFEKKLATIVFTTFIDTDGSEVSGYLDLGMSWANTRRKAVRHTNWPAVYEGRHRLEPMPHHLSYFNRKYNVLHYTDSDNFKVVHDGRYGMMFQHKGDRKILPVGGKWNPFSKNVTRTMAISPKQGTIVFYDHIIRKKV